MGSSRKVGLNDGATVTTCLRQRSSSTPRVPTPPLLLSPRPEQGSTTKRLWHRSVEGWKKLSYMGPANTWADWLGNKNLQCCFAKFQSSFGQNVQKQVDVKKTSFWY